MKVKTKPIIHDHILDEYSYSSLESNKVYNVIEIDDESYRVINKIGEPILYPKYLFVVVDSYIPQSWTRDDYEDGEYFIGPPELKEKDSTKHFLMVTLRVSLCLKLC